MTNTNTVRVMAMAEEFEACYGPEEGALLRTLVAERDALAERVATVQCDCWKKVNALITKGHLSGKGWDKAAERNGLVLAANTIFKQPDTTGAEHVR